MAQGNYAIVDMDSRAGAALAFHRDYVAESLAAYDRRTQWRVQENIPVLAVLGRGRSGKDTAAEYVSRRTELVYAGSASNRLCKFVSHMVGLSEAEAFAERHSHCDFWIEAGHAVRRRDATVLARIGLGHGDMAIGLRGQHEVYMAKYTGVVDALVWIENYRAGPDATVEFTEADCDFSVTNHGSHHEFYRKLDTLIGVLRLPERK